MSNKLDLVEIAHFSSRLEAETIGHALDPYDIPFLVQSSDIGMFGPGHVGTTVVGASLMVSAERAEEVRDLLHCVVTPAKDGEPMVDDPALRPSKPD